MIGLNKLLLLNKPPLRKGHEPLVLSTFYPPWSSFVLVKDNRVVAVAEYMRDFNDLKLAYLFGLQLQRKLSGSRFRTHLLTKSHEHLKTQGFSKISLTVKPNNQVGLRLYEQFGFVKEAFIQMNMEKVKIVYYLLSIYNLKREIDGYF